SSAADNQQQHHHGEVVDRVCSAVVGALRAFPNALGVQAEGCVAALLLCRRSPAIRTLPSGERRVRLLKKRGLLRLAAECLHELVLQPWPKRRRAAQSNSQWEQQIGQSPSDLLDTVYCLLEKGAVNTQSALEKSLTLGTDMVTGLLLKHLGYYKQGSFGSITWCNLKLQSFQARWLDPQQRRLNSPRPSRLNCGIVGIHLGCTGGRWQAPESAGAVIGLDDILPERYRLAQWTSASKPEKDERSRLRLAVNSSLIFKTTNWTSSAATTEWRRRHESTRSMVSLLLRVGCRVFLKARADSLASRKTIFRTHNRASKKLSDGADSSAASASNASAKSNSRDRRRTLAAEVLASQIERSFRKRSDTIRSDPDAAVAGVACRRFHLRRCRPTQPATRQATHSIPAQLKASCRNSTRALCPALICLQPAGSKTTPARHPKQRPRHRQVEQQPAAGNNLEVRRGQLPAQDAGRHRVDGCCLKLGNFRGLWRCGGGDHSDSVVKVRPFAIGVCCETAGAAA
uniref:RICTOR_V domain-containing protein n=1 Tax=Macrostomum lignano TaxID=282301 RepID=A0A1I8FPQ3_9PLAT